LKGFKVIDKPVFEKININVASVEEISQLIYIKYVIAQRIVEYREINGTIISFDELTKIEDFPIDKIHRIKLYLTL
jgi:DNA uptake protein ComE-like DNA-binding protein